MTKGTFGESLKREREMRGVTLEEIAAATRIAPRFLRAIEDEQWDQLPGGVFNRGFVRAMAHYLGLDEENTVAEYALAVDERQTVPVWTGSPPAVTPQLPRIAWVVIAAVAIVLLAAVWLGTRIFLARRAAGHEGQAQSLAANAAAASSASSDSPSPLGTSVNSVVAASSAPITSPANPPAAGALQLKMQADKDTAVTIIADKDVVFKGGMKAGESRAFSASDHFQVSVEDAGAVHLELNGRTLAPLGSSGHSGKVILTREALEGAAGGHD